MEIQHATRRCCFISPVTKDQCPCDATWQAFDGPKPDDYVDACDEHLGHLLSDKPVHQVYLIDAPRQVAVELLKGKEPEDSTCLANAGIVVRI